MKIMERHAVKKERKPGTLSGMMRTRASSSQRLRATMNCTRDQLAVEIRQASTVDLRQRKEITVGDSSCVHQSCGVDISYMRSRSR